MPKRYIVHGTDTRGQQVRFALEAESAGDAETAAAERGVQVRKVELDADTKPAAALGPAAPEEVLWHDSPSQWPNAGWFASCLLVLPIPYAIWKYLQTRCTKIRLSTERLRIESGVLNKRLEEVELYRVKDTTLTRSFWQRMVGLGTVTLVTSDATLATVRLAHLKDAEGLREILRKQVEMVRRARGVRELDVAEPDALLG